MKLIKVRQKTLKLNVVLAGRPVDNSNIFFTILQENFTSDTLTEVW